MQQFLKKQLSLLCVTAGLMPMLAFARAPVIDATPSGIYQQPVAKVLTPQQKMHQTASLEARVKKLEQSFAGYQAIPGKVVQLTQTMQDLRNLIMIQGQEIQQLEKQLKSQASASRRAGIKPVISAKLVAKQSLPVPKAKPVVTSSESKHAYETAYALIKKQRYSQAMPALKNFVTRYPHSPQAGSAYYWLGQLQAIAGNAQLAQQNFMTVSTEYPQAAEAPNAMLRLAEILSDQHQKALSQHWLNEIIKQYPKSSAARLAKLKLGR